MRLRTVNLGSSGLDVTEFCFGTLTLAPLQANLSPDQGGQLIQKAISEGVTFIDTAQGYKNYPHVRAGITGYDRKQLVIATKSLAESAEDMQDAFDEACEVMGISYVDIFHLHGVSSPENFQERKGALKKLKELKSKGLVKAIGVSSHSVETCRHILGRQDIDVCHPLFNKRGLGINHGTVDEMAEILNKLHDEGKGIYVMKPLAGGHLIEHSIEAFDFVRNFECIDAVAVGMKDKWELEFNLAYFKGQDITEEMKKRVSMVKHKLFINQLCKRCGTCVEFCEQHALSLGERKAAVNGDKCILCGYCAPECPEFAIRIV